VDLGIGVERCTWVVIHTYRVLTAAFGITERSRKLGRYKITNTENKKDGAAGSGGRCWMKGKGRWTADGAKVLLCESVRERRRVHVVGMYV
jgi:hypothetical protein